MKSSSEAMNSAPSLSSSKRGPLAELFRNVLLEFKETKSSRNFGSLWSSISPSGNIYRYLGISSERMAHCWDLQLQLRAVAETHKAFEGDDKSSSQQRVKRLITALKSTVPEGGFDGEAGDEPLKGFLPLEEFFKGSVTCTGFIVHPREPGDRTRWFVNHFLAFVVFLIQTAGVFCLFVQVWFAKENQLRDPAKMWASATDISEIICLGADRTAELTTLTGTLFILLVYSIVYSYGNDELENAEKAGRLPLSSFWTTISCIANAASGLLIVVAIPLEYWTEEGTQGIMMNSMALLFVFTLDDLTGDAFGYLATDDSQFQQQVAWNYALLAYCPISISSLIDPNAESVENIWKIKYDVDGSLLNVNGSACETRIMEVKAPQTESSLLVKKTVDEDAADDLVVEYCHGPSAPPVRLPGLRGELLTFIWTLTTWTILILWFVVPPVWFIVNKPCIDAKAPAE